MKIPTWLRWKVDTRALAFAALVLLLAASSYYGMASRSPQQVHLPVTRMQNAAAQNTAAKAPQPTPPSGQFTTYRQEMDNARAQEIAMLDALIADAKTSKETAEQARKQKLALAARMEHEATLESLLKARGYADVLVTVREGAVNVVVHQQAALTQEQVAQVLDLVTRQTGENARNVQVIPVP